MKCRYEFLHNGEAITTVIGHLPDVEKIEKDIMKKYNHSDFIIAWRGYVDDEGKYICLHDKDSKCNKELKTAAEIELGACESCARRLGACFECNDEQLEIICSKANPIDFAIEWERFWTDGEQEGVEQHESA